MEFKKERNFIVAYDGEPMGKWNITTGEFIGKSGKPVKRAPSAFSYQNLPSPWESMSSMSNLLGCAIRIYRTAFPNAREYNQRQGQRFEELVSVGLLPNNISDLFSTQPLTKNIVEYCKTEYHGYYSQKSVKVYLIKKENSAFLENRPKWICSLFRYGIENNLPLDYLKTFLNRAQHENIKDLFENYAGSDEAPNTLYCMLREYYKKCNAMYGEVKVTPNLLSNYAQINALYNTYKQEQYDEYLNKNNNKPFLYFQYNGFEARPLLTRQEFHYEGTNQRNCVERLYMDKVFENETYITVIRSMEEPDRSLVTCEVTLDGEIKQYLGFANSGVRSQALLEFKNAYRTHIMTNIG